MNKRTHPNNSNAFRATYPRMAEVRPRRLGLAVLNFPPIPVARDGTLRRLSHQMKSRSRWRRPSWALELNEEGWGECACRGIGPQLSGAKAVGVSLVSDSKTGVLPPSILSCDHHHHLLTCSMATRLSASRPRLVGRPLLYSITAFASLGVFLVSHDFHTPIGIHPPFSLDMIKGNASYFEISNASSSHCPSVMSGIITGPHFRKYFNSPGSLEIGTMVAVLEIGAFSTYSALGIPYWVLSDEHHK